jgi:hypothetical protein
MFKNQPDKFTVGASEQLSTVRILENVHAFLWTSMEMRDFKYVCNYRVYNGHNILLAVYTVWDEWWGAEINS